VVPLAVTRTVSAAVAETRCPDGKKLISSKMAAYTFPKPLTDGQTMIKLELVFPRSSSKRNTRGAQVLL
jgi:hypothetical protein